MSDVTIPPEARKAGAIAEANARLMGRTSEDTARAAFLAIVEAWPGMETGLFAKGERDNVLAIILPLPTEKTDG